MSSENNNAGDAMEGTAAGIEMTQDQTRAGHSTTDTPTGTEATMKWWQEAVIYQIYPRSFQDSNGDGVGDLNGIIERLDYLNDGTPNSLGVDAIWLSPIYPSPMHDFGYDISDYSDIDPLFGDLEVFQRLLTEAHKRNIRIIMDLVINHTSHLHPWFQESRSSKDNPKRDWYIWKDAKKNVLGRKKVPNNWLGMFGGKGWKWDEHTQQYYFHSFLSQQPDLNWHNPEVKEAVFNMVKGWLDMGVDGFRLDVINYIFKDDQWRNNPVQHLKAARPYDRQRHVHDRDQQPHLSGMLKDLRTVLESYDGDRTSVGEIQIEDHTKVKQVASVVGGKEQLHMAFNFAYFFTPWNARMFRKRIHEWDTACQKQDPVGGWPTYTLSNHDYPRHISRYSPVSLGAGGSIWCLFAGGGGGSSSSRREYITQARARVAALMLLTLRGTPFLYYGEEIGMREEPVMPKNLQDPVGLRFWPFHPGRDGCRRPMAWNADASQGGGFASSAVCSGTKAENTSGSSVSGNTNSSGDSKPWLPLSRNLNSINVDTQNQDSSSLLNFYKKCIWFRRGDEILRYGDQHIIMDGEGGDKVPKGVMAYVREFKAGRRLILLNFTSKRVTVPLFQKGYFADATAFQAVLSTDGDRAVAATNSSDDAPPASSSTDPSVLHEPTVSLLPNEGLVIQIWRK